MTSVSKHRSRKALLSLALILTCLPATGRGQRPIAFDHILVDPAAPLDPWGKCVADVNGDGAPDLVVGGNESGGLVWYESPLWNRHVISGLAGFRTDHEAGDVDRDGLMDVVSLGTDSAGSLWLGWFRNPGEAGGDWTAQTIDTLALHDIEVADLNGDGRVDVVGRNQEEFPPGNGDTLHVYVRNLSQGWSTFRIPCANGEGLKISDINRDARPDIIINGTWLENTGVDTVWIAHEYTATYTYRSVAVDVADIDGDSFADILLAPSEPIGETYRISWFKAPPDPTLPGWEEHIVEDGVETVHHSMGAADFDNDGTMDIATAKMHGGLSVPEVKVFLNDGQGLAWTKQVIATTGSHSLRVVDIDGNGSKDLFGANWRGEQVDLWVNQPDTLIFTMQVGDDAGASQTLEFGLGRYATDSLDAVLREAELPGLPAPGQFDARFAGARAGGLLGRGSYRDIRRGDSATVGVRLHELRCQFRPGGRLTISVDLPPQVLVRLHQAEPGGGVDTTLGGRSTFTIQDRGAPLSFLVNVTYILSPPAPPQLRSPGHGAREVEAQPLLSWSPVEYCHAYHVRVGVPGASSSPVIADTMVADTSFQLPILDSLTTYWWSVSGVNTAGEGEPGLPWEFKTKEFTADPSVLGLWRLNEPDGAIVYDLTLHSNDGVAVGTSVVSARYGTGREFNGTSDYIDLPESRRLFKPGSGLTVEAWLYLQSYPSGFERAAIVSTGSQRDYELAVTASGRLQGHLHSSSGPDSIEGRTTLPLRTWNHVALTFDGSSVRLFVNGVLDGERSQSGMLDGSAKTGDLLIGACARNQIVTELLTGVLDEVRIMKVARRPEEFSLQLPPAGLEATPGPDRVGLAWMNGGGGAPLMRYRVYRGEDSSATSLIDSTREALFIDSTGVPMRAYTYRVAAVDSTGFEGHSALPVRAASLLGVPRLISPPDGGEVGPESVVCAWTSSSPDVANYWFEMATDSGFTFRTIDSALTDTMTTVQDLTGALRYWWRVRAYNPAGWGPYSAVRTFTVPLTTAGEGGDLPREYGLSQNYPNPFNPETSIRFQIPTSEHVRLSVFDMLGREVEVLVDDWREAGKHEAIWDGSHAASGVYVCRLTAGSFMQIRRMMLLK